VSSSPGTTISQIVNDGSPPSSFSAFAIAIWPRSRRFQVAGFDLGHTVTEDEFGHYIRVGSGVLDTDRTLTAHGYESKGVQPTFFGDRRNVQPDIVKIDIPFWSHEELCLVGAGALVYLGKQRCYGHFCNGLATEIRMREVRQVELKDEKGEPPGRCVLAEADGNRTRQGPNRPLTGFEDRGTHQASGRLLDEDQEVRQA